jgi:hypothetical protein
VVAAAHRGHCTVFTAAGSVVALGSDRAVRDVAPLFRRRRGRRGGGRLGGRRRTPRGPQLEELDEEDSPFAREYQDLREQVDGGTFEDLHEPV